MNRTDIRISAAVVTAVVVSALLAGAVVLSEVVASASLPVLLLPEIVVTTAKAATRDASCGADYLPVRSVASPFGIEAVAALPVSGSRCVDDRFAAAAWVPAFSPSISSAPR